MRKMTRSLVTLLCVVLCLSLCPAALAASGGLQNFQRSKTYVSGTFTDVPVGRWDEEYVKGAYEMGLVNGTSDTTFAPDKHISLAEVLALACRVHSTYYTGAANFGSGTPWYQPYVDYAVQNGLISAGQYSDYTAPATRRQVAGILAKAMPAESLAARNTVEDGTIPDVAAGSAYYDEIYTLYRAGICTGNDPAGKFDPEDNIKRSEVAALVTRMADPALRRDIELKKTPAPAVGTAPEETKVKIMTITLTALEKMQDGLTHLVNAANAEEIGQSTSAINYANTSVGDFASAASSYASAIQLCGDYSDTQVVKANLTKLHDMCNSLGSFGTISSANLYDYMLNFLQVSENIDTEAVMDALTTEFGAWTGVDPNKPAGTTSGYVEFPSVPDFGAFGGIYGLKVPLDDGACSYNYSIEDVAELRERNSNYLNDYEQLLLQNGFVYDQGFDDEDGNPVVVYSNGTLYVFIGITQTDVGDFLTILVSY